MEQNPLVGDDDLLSPSLSQTSRRELPAGSRPWRLGSQFYVAFFGGPLALGAIGFLNAERLGLPRVRALWIAGIGIAAFAAVVAAALLLDFETATPRLLVAVAGVASFAAARELQKEADRYYGLNRNEELAYDSLWQPGLVAVLVCGIGSLALLQGLT